MATLSDVLSSRTRPGEVVEPLDRQWVQCHACGHDCRIPPGALGICKVRFNDGGTLRVPWGYVAGVQCDPIEKKPFFHAWPGALAYSFGMLGCDLHCGYCQNWVTSQALRDPRGGRRHRGCRPGRAGRAAVRQRRPPRRLDLQRAADHRRVGGRGVQGSARARASLPAFVSNGNGTPQVLDYIAPWIDLYKVDLKSFDDKHYRKLGGRLQPSSTRSARCTRAASGSRSSRSWCPASTTPTRSSRG